VDALNKLDLSEKKSFVCIIDWHSFLLPLLLLFWPVLGSVGLVHATRIRKNRNKASIKSCPMALGFSHVEAAEERIK